MRIPTDLGAFLLCLLCGVAAAAVAVEISQSHHGSYGLCRIYSYNIQLTSGTTYVDERHFFVCCADSGNEVNCHDQTLQNPSRREGMVLYWIVYASLSAYQDFHGSHGDLMKLEVLL